MNEPWIFTLISLTILAIQSYLIWRKNKSTEPVDASQTALNLSEVADRATARRLELEKRVESLESRLNQSYYSVTVVFSIGDDPKVERVTIQPVKVEKLEEALNK